MSLLGSLFVGGWLRSVDAGLARSMARARPDTPDLVLAAAALASRAVANGHSQLPLAASVELLLEIASDRDPPALPPLDEWLSVLAASPWTGEEGVLVLEGDALSLRRYWSYEVRLAEVIAQLGERLSIVTGGPGTGKTTMVALAMVEFARRFDGAARQARIALAAPTGKAAARLAEAVRENLAVLLAEGAVDATLAQSLPGAATTLHRLLGWQSGSVAFRHTREHPLRADLVIVDEASMIDLPLMCKLLEAIPVGGSVILIGDRDQLPSVETGDVLGALCDVSDGAGASSSDGGVQARRIRLTHSHRQSGDIDVPALAALVREGDADGALDGLAGAAFRGVHWFSGSDRALADAMLAEALPVYRAVQGATDAAAALVLAKRFRVLTAVRDGGAGSQTLNALIATALDPARRGDGFFTGRLLLVTENSYRHQLFNGDIGIAWPDEFGDMRVWFEAQGGPRAWLPAALPAHESAFALTVHKSQGSEFERVWLALPERGARVISRELIYTGLTRCRAGVTLWAGEGVLRDGIGRRAQRWSGLAGRLLAS